MSLTPLANGFCFGEGPRWFEGLLWFSDMLGEAVHTVDLQGDVTTLPLAGHAPSGLGFRPDGSLLIASTESRKILRYDGESVETIADLSDVVPATSATWSSTISGVPTSDRRPFEGGVIVRVDPDGDVTVVAERSRLPQRDGHHARPRHVDRRRVHRQAVDRRSPSAQMARCPIGGSSPTGSTGRPTASRSTRKVASGRR